MQTIEQLQNKIEKLENKLRESKKERNFYKEILNKVPALISIDKIPEKQNKWINDFVKEIGEMKSKKTGADKFLAESIHPDDMKKIEEKLKKIRNNGRTTYQGVYRIKDRRGNYRWLHLQTRTFKYNGNGQPDLLLSFSVDITSQVERYKQLRRFITLHVDEVYDEMLKQLTEREKEVLALLAAGDSVQEIADKLFISFHTVRTHKRNVQSKLGMRTTNELVRFAVETGIA